MAIDHADIVASLASIAGGNFLPANAFNPSDSVHSLVIHGTEDTIALYDGGFVTVPCQQFPNCPTRPYPGAEESSTNWANYNGLQTSSTPTGSFNLDLSVAGDETTSLVYDLGNDQGTAVELWMMNGSAHSPRFGNGASNLLAPRLVDWLLAHRKPQFCDFDNADGCNSDDIDKLITEIASGSNNPGFDLNNDDAVNLQDRDLWLSIAGELNLGTNRTYLLGDANLDGNVDVGDFNIWNASKFTNSARWSDGDFSADGVVDISDFNLWNANKFTSSDRLRAVPEPRFCVWMVVLLGLVFRRR